MHVLMQHIAIYRLHLYKLMPKVQGKFIYVKVIQAILSQPSL